jgi:hypothetical protein
MTDTLQIFMPDNREPVSAEELVGQIDELDHLGVDPVEALRCVRDWLMFLTQP